MKKFLFTLAALLMAGSALADSGMFFGTLDESTLGTTNEASLVLTQDDLAGEYEMLLGAYWSARVSGTECQLTFPEGMNPVFAEPGADATVQDASVKELTDAEDKGWTELATAGATVSVAAYDAFTTQTKRSGSDVMKSASVVNFASGNATVVPTEGAKSEGFNLYGNTSLGSSELQSITLQAYGKYGDEVLSITENEGTKVVNAVIDLASSSTSHTVLIGEGTGEVDANHTVLGGSNGDTIKFGDNATGSNVAKAGNGNTYLVNTTGKSKKSSLIGGSGDRHCSLPNQ